MFGRWRSSSSELVGRAANTLVGVMASPDDAVWEMAREEFAALVARAAQVAALP